ncbi:hypothetical protein F4825DRAFT_418412 [Nemania diffusa]|nr:hypothetical protein F4825DRAFT_418412 [Nemania diffusa]
MKTPLPTTGSTRVFSGLSEIQQNLLKVFNDSDMPSSASSPIDLGPAYALYTLVELSDQEITEVEAECNIDTMNGCFHVRRAPSYNMQGQPLRAAFQDYLESTAPSSQFEDDYFIAVADRDWKTNGVVIVAVDEEDDAGDLKFDKMTVPAGDVGDVLVNLSTANLGWWEFEEEYGRSEWEEGMMAPAHKPFDQHQTDEEYSDGSSTRLTETEYWIGLYAIDGIDFETVMRHLEPDDSKPVDRLTCRPQGRVPDTTREEIIATAARLHPMRCRNNPHLHRTMFLVADILKDEDEHVKNEDEGIIFVRIDWDQDINSVRSLADLAHIGSTSETDCQRLRYNSYTTLKIFDEINEGSRPWRYQHKLFFAYAGPRHSGRPDVYLEALDDTFASQDPGLRRFLEGRTLFDTDPIGRIIEDWKEGFETVLRQHWGFVHQERFSDTLVPEYFVYCDRSLTSADTLALVTLVKADKDGEWSAMKCEAGDAYEALCGLVTGTREWKGEEIIPEE